MLAEIEHLASLLFSMDEIVILTNNKSLSEKFIIQSSDEYNSYYRGYLSTIKIIRNEIIESAKQGSPAAQKELIGIISKIEIQNKRHG